ncbi:MAG: NrpR regulatory domain-containing protein [Dehalococcoidales bacterium]|nr:NrpR regulatory domain-containing protein [Dehalococcoidales bacterium]
MKVIGQESREVEREKVAILKILGDHPGAVGSNIIARRLKEKYNIELSERAVRYHLRLMDERGLTQKVSRRDGRDITRQGLEELKNAMVADKVGFIIDKIELLAYQTSFDPDQRQGMVPINISMFPRERFKSALRAMAGAFKAKLCVSDMVAVAEEGERLGDILVPEGNMGLATVCSLVVNGTLLKEGVPMDSRFGGLLQLRNNEPWRFTELIEYAGSSLDPSEILIASRMTSIRDVISSGSGKMLANFREVPAVSIPVVEVVMKKLGETGIGGLTMMGEVGKPMCEVPVGLNKVGMVLTGGLNPVAAAVEAGINVANIAMGGLIDYKELKSFWDL